MGKESAKRKGSVSRGRFRKKRGSDYEIPSIIPLKTYTGEQKDCERIRGVGAGGEELRSFRGLQDLPFLEAPQTVLVSRIIIPLKGTAQGFGESSSASSPRPVSLPMQSSRVYAAAKGRLLPR